MNSEEIQRNSRVKKMEKNRPGLAMPITINTKLKYCIITEISSK
jgi:hypothetical protein